MKAAEAEGLSMSHLLHMSLWGPFIPLDTLQFTCLPGFGKAPTHERELLFYQKDEDATQFPSQRPLQLGNESMHKAQPIRYPDPRLGIKSWCETSKDTADSIPVVVGAVSAATLVGTTHAIYIHPALAAMVCL